MAQNAHSMVRIEGLSIEFLKSLEPKSGSITLFSPTAVIQTDSLYFNVKDLPLVGEAKHGRKLATPTGTRSVLIVRVIGTDTSPTSTASQISNAVFGTFGNANSLKNGFASCSYNQLLMNPTTRATNGVVDISISKAIKGFANEAAVDAAESILKTKFNVQDLSSLFDLVAFCIPSGTSNDFLAYAYINHWKSVYSDARCVDPGVYMHEFGHNFNLGHSGEGTNEYEDRSCSMGYSCDLGKCWPRCFNGAKSFQLGWYNSRTTTINMLSTSTVSPTTITLIGVSDHQNSQSSSSAKVVVKLETGTIDHYIAFNRQSGINSGTGKYGNEVIVTKSRDTNDVSFILAHSSSTGLLFMTTVTIGTSIYDIKVVVNSINLSTNPGQASITVSRTLRTAPVVAPVQAPITVTGRLGDWEFCVASAQCNNGCCSAKYSNDGKLKCTPLLTGYNPATNKCVGDAGDWSTCSSSSQCRSGCCSGLYSQGTLKCTKLNAGYDPVANGCK